MRGRYLYQHERKRIHVCYLWSRRPGGVVGACFPFPSHAATTTAAVRQVILLPGEAKRTLRPSSFRIDLIHFQSTRHHAGFRLGAENGSHEKQ